MEQFMEIATQADNIPIIGMLVLVLICLGLAMKQAFVNDRLIDRGQKDKIFREMYK